MIFFRSLDSGVFRFFFILLVLCLTSIEGSVARGSREKKFVLVIDAGHGGKDHGAVGKLTREKDINLNVALAFGKLVQSNCSDVKVVYTRTSDVFVPLQTRADIANHNKADLFVSVHTNSVASNKNNVYGAETYSLGMHRSAENLEVAKRENGVITLESNYKQTYQNFDPRKAESYIIFELLQDRNMQQSIDMATCIQREYARRGRKNKGVKQSGFLVLRATSMPSVLTELGFISHPEEERFLHSNDGVRVLSQALYDAFLNYRKKNARRVDNYLPENEKDSLLLSPEILQCSHEHASHEHSAEDATLQVSSAVDLTKDVVEVIPVETRALRQRIEQENNTEEKKENILVEIANKNVLPADTPPNDSPIERATNQLIGVVETSQNKEMKGSDEGREETYKHRQAEALSSPAESVVENQPTAHQEVDTSAQLSAEEEPVFKVQILTSDRLLNDGAGQFKGLNPVDYYMEGNLYKYTYGSTSDFREIKQIKKRVAESFPTAFVVALKNGKRIDLTTAIRQTKTNSSHSQTK